MGLEFIDLTDRVVDPSVASLVSESLARRYQAIPVAWEDGRLLVALADPSNVFAVDDIRATTGADVKMVVSTASQIMETIERFYRVDGDVDAVVQAAADEQVVDTDLGSLADVVEGAPIVKFVNMLITQATQDRASDIHVEPTEHDLRIRFRIDGVLHEVMRSPRNIKTVSSVASRSWPTSTSPNVECRKTVVSRTGVGPLHRSPRRNAADRVRREDRHAHPRQGQALLARGTRLPAETLGRFENCYRKPYGTILVTGPTGSGKSTTLYAALNQVNEPDRNIITVRTRSSTACRHQSGAGAQQGRSDVRVGTAIDPACRPRHHPHR